MNDKNMDTLETIAVTVGQIMEKLVQLEGRFANMEKDVASLKGNVKEIRETMATKSDIDYLAQKWLEQDRELFELKKKAQ